MVNRLLFSLDELIRSVIIISLEPSQEENNMKRKMVTTAGKKIIEIRQKGGKWSSNKNKENDARQS